MPIVALLLLGPILAARSASGLTAGPLDLLQGSPEEALHGGRTLHLRIHPFLAQEAGRLKPGQRQALQLLGVSAQTLAESVKRVIREDILNPFIKMQSQTEAPSLEGPTSAYQELLTGHFEAGGVPFCSYELKAHSWSDGRTAILGDLPLVDAEAYPPAADEWPSLDEGLASVRERIEGRGLSELELEKARACLYVQDGQFVPVWELRARVEGLPYLFQADEASVYHEEKRFFEGASVEGKVQAYTSNSRHGTLKTFTTSLVGDGTLTSEFFITDTLPSQPDGTTRAQSASNEFIFDPGDKRFDEASAFIHATQAYEFFKDLGYTWAGTRPLRIRLHAILSDTRNNALYEPDNGGTPLISLGDGDGVGLTNLATDADVVSHEFGHHIVYRSLKATVNESLVLHEGLADFFAFSKTGDACLGESICPASSPFCVVKGECLRSAATSLTYDTPEYRASGAHLRGQIVSGMLWDLREKLGAAYLTKMVYRALDFFVSASGFGDFVVTLLLADKELKNGENACAILAAADERGLDKFLVKLDCHETASWVLPSKASSQPVVPQTSERKSSDGGSVFGCGALAAGAHHYQSSRGWPLGLFLLSPLLLCLAYLLRGRNKGERL